MKANVIFTVKATCLIVAAILIIAVGVRIALIVPN
jgi:hypothetical protein